MGSGTIQIFATGYRLVFDASHLTPSTVGGQIFNAHLGTCENVDVTNNQLVATMRPDANGQAHVQVDYPTPYARPPEGRVVTIHGSGDNASTHIACGALPTP
jgi:hypothetical protein